jgi:signal transduction histidine kinase/DNA-binding response OmpR family regulator
LANNIISFLTLYVEAQVGLFYGVEKSANSPQLRVKLLASYAYTRRKNLADEFAFSEGLVERAAREQKSILLTINTTLGEGIPPQIFLIPFLHENVIRGVIQLGSTEPMTDIQQEFLKQVIANIGIAVNSIEARTKMQELLQQTQIQAEALQSQKDELQYQKAELQQQKEELQSQTEELQSQSEELQSQTEELRHANEEMEERTKELEQQKEEGRLKNLMLEKTQQTMQLKAEELERASKYKSEFLANMSHELRTPLNSMLILAQLLAENKAGNLEDKQVEYARTIHSAGGDLLTLINEILDLSKVEAGKMEVQAEDVSLMELTESIEQKFRPVATEKGLTFALTVAPAVPPVLNTDAQRLKQILNNLLSNAFKFTAQGEVKLTITKAAGPQHFSFAVTDTGIGIPRDKQGLIFEAFQQADGSTSRRFGGTGLGLSISRQLARLLGGDIHLHSEEGQGSTFTLSLPESLPKQSENISRQTSPETGYPGLPLREMTTPPVKDTVSPSIMDDRDHLQSADKTILVIEDDRKFSTILMELAREKGFKCLLAEDGRMGLQVAEQYQPQAIILDVGLPKLNGWNVMEKLKENSKTRHIPVHFMSAADQSQDAKQMGAIGYLLKPVSIGQLSEAFTKIEQFIAKTMKNLLVVVDDSQRQRKILELVGNEGIETTRAFTKKDALRQLHTTPFDCIILDVDTEQASGLKLLEELREEEDLLRVPVIIYAERDLTVAEEDLLKLCADKLTVKAVKSPERLLEEATLFLHQVETHLPKDKRQMLQMMHDKESILRDKKVLIVDDDTRNTFALVTVLEDKDLVAIAGKNGREALELLEEHPDIDIVLMDIMMPEMDGYEAIRRIRAQPRLRKLPIIALTAKAMKGDKAKCIEAGANDYLSKPIDNDKLLSLMRVWLYR